MLTPSSVVLFWKPGVGGAFAAATPASSVPPPEPPAATRLLCACGLPSIPGRGTHTGVDRVSPLPSSPLPDDVLTKDAGECVICLEELLQGDTIARLPCLCIYHKRYCRGRGDAARRGGKGTGRGTSRGTAVTRSPLSSCIDSWFEVNRSCPEHPSD